MKPCRTDIEILFTLEQDVCTYVGDSIYGVRLQVNVGDSQAKKNLSVHCCIVFKKKLKKITFVSDRHCREGGLNLVFL